MKQSKIHKQIQKLFNPLTKDSVPSYFFWGDRDDSYMFGFKYALTVDLTCEILFYASGLFNIYFYHYYDGHNSREFDVYESKIKNFQAIRSAWKRKNKYIGKTKDYFISDKFVLDLMYKSKFFKLSKIQKNYIYDLVQNSLLFG